MKIRSVRANNHRKAFDVTLAGRVLSFPYAKATPRPTVADRIVECRVDAELAREAFTYVLASGHEGSIHVEQVLEYNQDPAYLRDVLLYKLTVAARQRVEESPLSKRELIRQLGTSAAQFYRVLDPANTRTSVDQVLALLHLLDCEVDVVVRDKSSRKPSRAA